MALNPQEQFELHESSCASEITKPRGDVRTSVEVQAELAFKTARHRMRDLQISLLTWTRLEMR